MHSINLLIKQLQADYPSISFATSDDFKWSARGATIFYDPKASEAEAFCLHELSHAVLEHYGYKRDIELLQHERDAWKYAQEVLAVHYSTSVNDNTIQTSLDTYRDWLHARSTCPSCKATGVQVAIREYKCVACSHAWRVNEARMCALKRYDFPLTNK